VTLINFDVLLEKGHFVDFVSNGLGICFNRYFKIPVKLNEIN